jgi:hypothetical protein
MVRGAASPDDPALDDYWAKRRSKAPPLSIDTTSLRLFDAQHRPLSHCGDWLLPVTARPQSPREWQRWQLAARKTPRERTARRTTSNPVSYTPTATPGTTPTEARHQHVCPPTSPRDLLEPDAAKAASPVLRGAGRSSAPGLPGDAKKLVRLYRAGELTFVMAPTPEQEGLRDLVRCREDLRDARTRARHRALKQLLRHGLVFRDGAHWTLRHRAWLRAQRLDDALAQAALEQMLCHLDSIDAQIRVIDGQREQAARSERWAPAVRTPCAFKGVSMRTALGLLAEIGDFRCFGSARELMS